LCNLSSVHKIFLSVVIELDPAVALPKSPRNRNFTELIDMYLNPNSNFNRYFFHYLDKEPHPMSTEITKKFLNSGFFEHLRSKCTQSSSLSLISLSFSHISLCRCVYLCLNINCWKSCVESFEDESKVQETDQTDVGDFEKDFEELGLLSNCFAFWLNQLRLFKIVQCYTVTKNVIYSPFRNKWWYHTNEKRSWRTHSEYWG
jgi:hypothetical protein